MKDKGCKDMEKGKVKSCTNYSHNTVNQLYFNKINKKKLKKKTQKFNKSLNLTRDSLQDLKQTTENRWQSLFLLLKEESEWMEEKEKSS